VSPDWPRVSKNERHGYEESEAAAPPPAPESETRTIQQYWNDYWIERGMHGAVYGVSDTGARSFAEQWARVRAAHLQAELDAIKKRRAEISATWGHVEGKIGCQCPICQKDFNAFMDAFEESDMQLNLPGGYKDRAEAAEARCRELKVALANLSNVMQASMSRSIRTTEQQDAINVAERALAPGQEEK